MSSEVSLAVTFHRLLLLASTICYSHALPPRVLLPLHLRGGLGRSHHAHVTGCEGGVGITCSRRNIIIHIRAGSAAEAADLRLGDRIMAVDGTALGSHKLADVVQMANEHTFELQRSLQEAAVEVRDAGPKGMGAFATQPLEEGMFVGTYVGTVANEEETSQRYDIRRGEQADYLFRLDAERGIDAQNSTHFSRYFNHHQHGNLQPVQNVIGARIDFFAKRDIEIGEELTFDCERSRSIESAHVGAHDE